jgi:hypothetical protein
MCNNLGLLSKQQKNPDTLTPMLALMGYDYLAARYSYRADIINQTIKVLLKNKLINKCVSKLFLLFSKTNKKNKKTEEK